MSNYSCLFSQTFYGLLCSYLTITDVTLHVQHKFPASFLVYMATKRAYQIIGIITLKCLWSEKYYLFQVRPFVSLKRLQMGIFSFLTERDWSRRNCYGSSTRRVILFLLWYTFVMPIFKNTASIFPEMQCIVNQVFFVLFSSFTCKQYDINSDLICITEKFQYL